MMVVNANSVLGLPAARGKILLGQLGCGDQDAEATLAHVIWSHLCEPGDMLAGALVQKLGPVEALSLIRGFDAAQALIAALANADAHDELLTNREDLASELSDGIARWRARDNNAAVLRSLELWARLDGQIVTPDAADWPPGLELLGAGAPRVLWLRGQRGALGSLDACIAMVGSRNVSSHGVHAAQAIAESAVAAGLAVVSGGAYGVDAEAHRGTLAAGGITIAVLAGGGDRFYPVGNADLLRQILISGCILAEQAPGNSPTRWRFLQRNRLIAALGEATVIVEMAVISGAKNTMHHALAMGRAVYAVPGQMLSATARGCNIAIAEGKANIASGADEVIKEILGVGFEYESKGELTALQQRILDATSVNTASVERLGIRAGTTNRETLSALGALELLGLVERRERGWARPTLSLRG